MYKYIKFYLCIIYCYFIYLFIYLLTYLFIFRERGREGEREKHECVVASHMAPSGDLAQKPRHVPWLGINLVTLWFTAHT